MTTKKIIVIDETGLHVMNFCDLDTINMYRALQGLEPLIKASFTPPTTPLTPPSH
jgi:hypothetical protein